MKIYGIGVDIVNISRVKKNLTKNKLFKQRIFSNKEIKYCERKINKYECFSKRFAAKEAFSKALGTGISSGINFNEIIVKNEKNGKPFIRLKGETKKKIDKKLKKKAKFFLSLSDEQKYAVAFVTIFV